MSEEFEVHGQHDHAVEHAAHTDSLGRWVAMFTAILATMGALISYQNGNAESRGLELKNEAILKKSAASDQWAYYQAKGIKQVIVERAPAATADERTAQAAEAARYAKEKEDIQVEAKKLDAESAASDAESIKAVAPHHARAGRDRDGRVDGVDAATLDAELLGSVRRGRHRVLDHRLALARLARLQSSARRPRFNLRSIGCGALTCCSDFAKPRRVIARRSV
jgi:hypothetical protein